MTEILAAEAAGKTAWAILKPIAGFLACAAVGFAAAETYEHKVPWGLKHQRDTAVALQTTRFNDGVKTGIQAQVKADGQYFDLWAKRVAKDDADAADARNTAADALARAAANTSKQASAAYNMGRASCGAHEHVDTPIVRSGVDHPPGSVLYDGQSGDFADLIAAGAYSPAR